MSVFFRWGVFGILGVAALVYAYNASKHMAEKRAAREVPAASVVAQPGPPPAAEPEPAPRDSLSPRCAAELVVAQRALEARAQGEPLDRLLRIQEIAFQESPRRERLEKVATDWYRLEGPAPAAGALSAAVVSECNRPRPSP